MIEILESSYRLILALERVAPIYRGGEVVRGTVSVAGVAGAGTLRAIIVSLEWRTLGDSNRDRGPARKIRIPVSSPAPGELLREPFELELPTGPVSYRGNLFSVQWFVSARADVALAVDPTAEESIEVLPPEAPAPSSMGEPHRQPAIVHVPEGHRHEGGPLRRSALPRRSKSTLALGVLVFCLGGLGLSALPFSRSLGMLALLVAVIAAGLMLGGSSLIRSARMRRRGSGALGEPFVEVAPIDIVRGRTLTVRTRVAPAIGVELDEATAELVAMEATTAGSGSSSVTRHHVVFSHSVELRGPHLLPAGESTLLECEHEIPADAPCSFGAPNNELTWSVRIRLEPRPDGARPAASGRGGDRDRYTEAVVVHVLPA